MSDYKPAPTQGSGLELPVEPEGAKFLDDADTKTYQARVGVADPSQRLYSV